jgi:hypothetical protein
LLDARPAWGGGKLNATSLFLEPLSEDETERLIDNLPVRLADKTRTRIGTAAEGNPLFVEQMLAMLTEEAGVEVEVELEIPPTIQALLAARLDRLPPAERAALERAAVIGKEFSRAMIEELGGDAAALPALVRKELIRPERSPLAGDDGLSLPAPAGSRRCLRLDLERASRRAARALRERNRAAAQRVRRDHRLPLRAGVPLPRAARCDRRRTRLPCRVPTRGGRAASRRTWRCPCSRELARAGACAHA